MALARASAVSRPRACCRIKKANKALTTAPPKSTSQLVVWRTDASNSGVLTTRRLISRPGK